MAKSKPQPCPCGSGDGPLYEQCCGRYISGSLTAPDALALMRSRYSAYVLEDQAYLQRTWHPRSRPELNFDQQTPCKWTGLQIVSHQQQETTATVEFVARYKLNGRAHQLHEVSKFELEDGQWFYVDGLIDDR